MPEGQPPAPGPPAPPPLPPPGVSGQRNAPMLVLAYLGLLALIPLMVEKDDREVQWHAKNGLVLTVAFVALFVALNVMGAILGLFWLLAPVVWLLWLVVVILGILRALNGQRFVVPGLSEYADKF